MDHRPLGNSLPGAFDRGLVIYRHRRRYRRHRRWFWGWLIAAVAYLVVLALTFRAKLLSGLVLLVRALHDASERHDYEGVLRIILGELEVLARCLVPLLPVGLVLLVAWWTIRTGKRIESFRQRFGFLQRKRVGAPHRHRRNGE